jgi:hypothetical protein
MRYTHGLPTAVSLMDMALQQREHDLVLATHGRGMYVIDDVETLRRIARDGAPAGALAALDSTPGILYQVQQPVGARFPGNDAFRGENPPYGATLTFWIADADLPHPDAERERARLAAAKPKANSDEKGEDKPKPLRVEIRDGAGKLVRHAEVEVKQGLNRWTWDLAHTAPRSPAPPGPFDAAGPSALPGSYTATLRRGDASATLAIEVLPDPRAPAETASLAAQQAAVLRASDLQDRIVDALERVANAQTALAQKKALVEQQIAARKRADPATEIGDEDAMKQSIKHLAERSKRLDEAALGLWQDPKKVKGYTAPTAAWDKLSEAQWMLGGSAQAPTPAALTYVERAAAVVEQKIAAADAAVAGATD